MGTVVMLAVVVILVVVAVIVVVVAFWAVKLVCIFLKNIVVWFLCFPMSALVVWAVEVSAVAVATGFSGFARGEVSIEVLFVGFVRDQESFQVLFISFVRGAESTEVLFGGFARGDGLLTEESMVRSAIAASAPSLPARPRPWSSSRPS